MSELSDQLEKALQSRKAVWICIGGSVINVTASGHQHVSVISSQAGEWLAVDDGHSVTKIYNLACTQYIEIDR